VTFLYLFTRAPYGHSIAREALDMALASAAFDQHVSLVFAQDAIYQLLNTQDKGNTEKKTHIGVINALPLYEIENIYYLSDDCTSRNISAANLAPHAKALSATELADLMRSADRIQSF
jgi:tRNA 2-thiouridine synthesizing protein C